MLKQLILTTVLLLSLAPFGTAQSLLGAGVSAGYVAPTGEVSALAGVSLLAAQYDAMLFAPTLWAGAVYGPASQHSGMDCAQQASSDACAWQPQPHARAEMLIGIGEASRVWVGPGLRFSFSGGPVEPYGFLMLGNEIFLKASIGSGFQVFEVGALGGLWES